MKKKKLPQSLLVGLFRKLAPKIGAKLIMEPEWNTVGQIVFKNGRKRYFRGTTLDLNPLGSSEIAVDKDYAAFFMKKMGYPAVPGKTFFSENFCRVLGSRRNIDAAYRHASSLKFPVIVKPNSGTRGRGVAKVHTKKDFYRAMRSIFVHDRIALVQKPVPGRDYRVVVLDGRVISAYERIPLAITGDGRSTVGRLLKKKQEYFIKTGRDTCIRIEDGRVAANLARQKLSVHSIIPSGKNIFLLDNANLSTGGDAIDVTATIHPAFRNLAIDLTKDMGLRVCGVDLMVNGDIAKAPARGKYWIIEINAAPGLDHYVKTGKAQQKMVEDMYLEVLKALE